MEDEGNPGYEPIAPASGFKQGRRDFLKSILGCLAVVEVYDLASPQRLRNIEYLVTDSLVEYRSRGRVMSREYSAEGFPDTPKSGPNAPNSHYKVVIAWRATDTERIRSVKLESTEYSEYLWRSVKQNDPITVEYHPVVELRGTEDDAASPHARMFHQETQPPHYTLRELGYRVTRYIHPKAGTMAPWTGGFAVPVTESKR